MSAQAVREYRAMRLMKFVTEMVKASDGRLFCAPEVSPTRAYISIWPTMEGRLLAVATDNDLEQIADSVRITSSPECVEWSRDGMGARSLRVHLPDEVA